MKLYVIGTSQQAQIRPASQYVSGYHAELLLLDNGDMLLTDRGSKNGTYVNGKKLTPDKDVNVRRGDDVKFADATLDWSQIPSNTVDMTRIQEIRSIGSHYMNKIQLHGDHVSRFHATLKKMKDGKWYIQDHSMNGTKVNGSPIPKDQDFRIKRGDVITCAGVPVKNPINPIPDIGGVLGRILGVAACIAIAIFVTSKIIIRPNYEETVAMIYTSYHYDIYVKGEKTRSVYDESFGGMATGFFISEDGKLVTNLHVAKPWMFSDVDEKLKEEEQAKYFASADFTTAVAETFDDLDRSAKTRAIASSVEVVGVMDELLILPNGKVHSPQNAIRAHTIAASNNIEVDIAVIQLDNNKTPDDADYVRLSKISKSSEDVVVGDNVYVLGFPTGYQLQLNSEDEYKGYKAFTLEAFRTEGTVTRSGSDVNFEHNAMTEGGSSGSPIFNDKGILVGVNNSHKNGGYDNNYNVGIDACLIHKLLNKEVEF